jgi:hypothetical protein
MPVQSGSNAPILTDSESVSDSHPPEPNSVSESGIPSVSSPSARDSETPGESQNSKFELEPDPEWVASVLQRIEAATGDDHSADWWRSLCREAVRQKGDAGAVAVELAVVEISAFPKRAKPPTNPGGLATSIMLGHLGKAGVRIEINTPEHLQIRQAMTDSLGIGDLPQERSHSP